MQHVDKKPIKYFQSWKYLKPLIHYIKWSVIPGNRVLCDPWSVELSDEYFQIILEWNDSVFEHVNTWGTDYKCSSFYVWDNRASELRLSVIYYLAPHQSLTMQIFWVPTRAMADSLRQDGSLLLEGVFSHLEPFTQAISPEQTNFSATPIFSPLHIEVVSSSTSVRINLDCTPTPLNVSDKL